jgi:murein endopeptidase
MFHRTGRPIDAWRALLPLALLAVPLVGAADDPGGLAGSFAGLAAIEPDPSFRVPDPEALRSLAERDPAALGPLSIGTPDAGLLVNPVPMPSGAFWKVRDPSESWGTDETVTFIETAIEAVEARYPGSPRLVIGDISRPDGGRLNRHRSHQAGRDADVGFYYGRGEVDSFLTARKRDLDLPRTWALVRALVTDTDVERIFVDRSIIAVLRAQAREEGEDPEWLAEIFGGRAGEKGIIQHERGHRNHMHVRFYNARAQERGRLVYPTLVETGVAPPPTMKHRVRSGETLGHLARRYGTSVSAIRAANGIRGSFLRAGRSYVIPVRKVPPDAGPVVVPARRLPPDLASPGRRPVPQASRSDASEASPGAPGQR